MNVEAQRQGNCLVLVTDGRVDGTTASEFQTAVTDAITEADQAVILDLESLSYISSAGLRAILLIARDLQREGKAFCACTLTVSVREVFEISGFDKIIPVHDSREAAIDSFAP